MIGEKAVKESALLPYEGMWMANLVFLAISLRLLYIANRNDISGYTIGHYTHSIQDEPRKKLDLGFIIKVISHNLYLLELLILIPCIFWIGIDNYFQMVLIHIIILVGLRIIPSAYYFSLNLITKDLIL